MLWIELLSKLKENINLHLIAITDYTPPVHSKNSLHVNM